MLVYLITITLIALAMVHEYVAAGRAYRDARELRATAFARRAYRARELAKARAMVKDSNRALMWAVRCRYVFAANTARRQRDFYARRADYHADVLAA